MAKDLNISRLCDVYGALLTEHMRDTVISYYDYDLSLAEIAENEGVTRQAVLAVLKKAESKLRELESVIGAVERTDKLILALNEIDGIIASDPESAKAKLEGVIGQLRER